MALSCSIGRRTALILCITVTSLALSACGDDGPQASPEDIERAKRIYTECVEDELGLEVVSLDISREGDIDVEFGAGYTKQDAQRAVEICERRIDAVINPGAGLPVLGPPPNLGRRGTDEDLIRLLNARGSLGFEGVVAIESQGVPRAASGFGKLSKGDARAPDLDTAFDCGSIMKPVTAATIFLLERDGLVSRDQTLDELFEDVPEQWRGVTLQQVLTHTAGFDDFHDTEGDFEEMDRATALGRIFAQEPRFAPGTDSSCSNSGFTLLAILIENLTGKNYRDVVRSRVFQPLGMARSGFYSDGLWEDGNVAIGRNDGVHIDNDPARWPEPTWALIGNGGLVSTVRDLLALAKGFEGTALFESEKTRAAFLGEYLGRTTASIGGHSVLGYAGANDYGFRAVVLQVPGDGTFVVGASHVLSAVHSEIVSIEALQVLYGAVLELPDAD